MQFLSRTGCPSLVLLDTRARASSTTPSQPSPIASSLSAAPPGREATRRRLLSPQPPARARLQIPRTSKTQAYPTSKGRRLIELCEIIETQPGYVSRTPTTHLDTTARSPRTDLFRGQAPRHDAASRCRARCPPRSERHEQLRAMASISRQYRELAAFAQFGSALADTRISSRALSA